MAAPHSPTAKTPAATPATPADGPAARVGLALSPPEREAYRERGFFLREVLPESELAVLRAAVEDIHARIAGAAERSGAALERVDGRRYQHLEDSVVKWEWAEQSPAIRSMEPVRHLSPALAALAADPRLCEPAAGLVGCSAVSLFTDKLNFKRPGGSPFPWHQDAPYWAFNCSHLDRLASVQLYLDAATEENGCLWVIPGSHRAGHLPAPDAPGLLARLYTDVDRLDGAQALPLAAPAGTAIFFHPYLVHGSRSNRSGGDRRALVLTYQPPDLPPWRAPRLPGSDL
jgi:phytanoyl-CoA hydroxylase